MSNSVQLAVNQGNLFANLKMAFSSKVTFLSELMQNARRSGASEICINFDNETATLTIHDNGSGIAEFQKLFTIAESGWCDELKQEEGAYGMGFLAALFACRNITVFSTGQRIDVDTVELITGASQPVTPYPDAPVQGTVITMSGLNFTPSEIESAVKSFARGFPIPVKFNDELLDRDHAEENFVTIDTSIGRIGISKNLIKARSWMIRDSVLNKFECYLQGLPISGFQSPWYRGEAYFIVHLDNKIKGKLPDREIVHDSLSWEAEFRSCLRHAVKLWLEQTCQEIGSEVFVCKFWHIAKEIHPELLNSISHIPAELGVKITSVQCESDYSARLQEINGISVISKNDYKGYSLALVDSARVDLSELPESSPELTYAHLHDLVVFNKSSFPSGHWVFEEIKSLTGSVKCTVNNGGNPFLTESFNGAEINFAICDSLDLDGPFGSVSKSTDEVAIFDGESKYGEMQYKMWTPLNVSRPGCGVEQLKTYESGCLEDGYKADLHHNDLHRIGIFIQQERGKGSLEIFQAYLANFYVDISILEGKSFKVSIRNGRVVVEDEFQDL